MGHGTNDKLFITPSEHSGVYGQHGASTGARRGDSSVVVPFHMCALTHEPWEHPACLGDEGLVYERRNLEAFLAKYQVSPASGRPCAVDEVISLHIPRNERGNFYDPVSCKELTDHSHLVAVRPTGNVFLHDTVQQLNIKPRMMRDLVDDTPFAKSDLITLQDPHDPQHRTMQNMHHVQNKLTLAREQQGDEVQMSTGSTRSLLSKVRKQTEPVVEHAAAASDAPAPRLTNMSTGRTAASFTSSSLTPQTKTERIAVDEEALMLEQVAGAKRAKAFVRLTTNFGALNLELHVDKAPKTCYNFLMLCRAGAYNDTIFHRQISGFMIQGGDPTGSGRGGKSCWGKPFEDELCNPGSYRHTGRGVLSMANKGPNTNGSQFFLTYRATPHLDTKHTVFGRLVSDSATTPTFRTLDALENVPAESGTDRPLRPIQLVEAHIIEDPFEDYKQNRDARFRRENMGEDEKAERDAKRRKREEDRTTWLGTRLAPKGGTSASSPRPSILDTADAHGLARLGAPRTAPKAPAKKRGFGDFAGW